MLLFMNATAPPRAMKTTRAMMREGKLHNQWRRCRLRLRSITHCVLVVLSSLVR